MNFGHFFIRCFHVTQCLWFSSAFVVIFESLLLFTDMHKQLSGGKDLWFITERNLKTCFLHFSVIPSKVHCYYYILIDYTDQYLNILCKHINTPMTYVHVLIIYIHTEHSYFYSWIECTYPPHPQTHTNWLCVQ